MVKQFEIYWVDLNPTIGAEMRKVRPCVIVSPKELNDHLGTVIIIPVTSSVHGYPYRVGCHIMGRNGEIATDQIRTVDKRRLKKMHWCAHRRRDCILAGRSPADVLRLNTTLSLVP